MKKILAVLLAALLTLSLAACGKAPAAAPEADSTGSANPILEYMDKGYTSNGVNIEDGLLGILFVSPERTDFVRVEVPLTEEEYAAYEALDFFAEDYDRQEKDFFAGLSGAFEVTDLNDQVPGQEELDALVGKTLGELETMGYEQTSMDMGDDDLVVFIYSDETMELMIYPEGAFEDLFSLADEELSTLKVARVQFYGFG